MDVVPDQPSKVARCLDGLGLLLHHIDGLLAQSLVRLGEVLALVVPKGDAADVLRILLQPLGDLDVWDTVPHLLVDGLDKRATANVAPSQDWSQLCHSMTSTTG